MNELRHLVDPLDLSFEETLRLLDLADSIANDRTASVKVKSLPRSFTSRVPARV